MKLSDLNAKPYAAVAYDSYYPSGGLDNIKGLFATRGQAMTFLKDLQSKTMYGYENLEVHDLRKFKPSLK